jgi:hypothetical protein
MDGIKTPNIDNYQSIVKNDKTSGYTPTGTDIPVTIAELENYIEKLLIEYNNLSNNEKKNTSNPYLDKILYKTTDGRFVEIPKNIQNKIANEYNNIKLKKNIEDEHFNESEDSNNSENSSDSYNSNNTHNSNASFISHKSNELKKLEKKLEKKIKIKLENEKLQDLYKQERYTQNVYNKKLQQQKLYNEKKYKEKLIKHKLNSKKKLQKRDTYYNCIKLTNILIIIICIIIYFKYYKSIKK